MTAAAKIMNMPTSCIWLYRVSVSLLKTIKTIRNFIAKHVTFYEIFYYDNLCALKLRLPLLL